MDVATNQMLGRHRMSNSDDEDIPGRPDPQRHRLDDPVTDDEDDTVVVSTIRKGIKIGNSQDVWNFYEQRFKKCEEIAGKLLAKVWVKAVEPKKQYAHPYSEGDEKAPEWWPKLWGLIKEENVCHMEPDYHNRGELTKAI